MKVIAFKMMPRIYIFAFEMGDVQEEKGGRNQTADSRKQGQTAGGRNQEAGCRRLVQVFACLLPLLPASWKQTGPGAEDPGPVL